MTDYTPSQDLTDALADLKKAQALVDECRAKAHAAVAADLKANPDVSVTVMARHVPWTDETLRQIARAHDVPLKRKPTVGKNAPRKPRKPAPKAS
ncbi:hypothetical protein [Streptomyces sp. NRRL B-1347]|uniref:hypothetical protein n=1 Tax=Streptomyces sp. NRRL B-1347 TaxID=1476877 RepID=UPI0004CB3702|nr:hypothetical protein [Streptomyces sp. NRRL B-1347]